MLASSNSASLLVAVMWSRFLRDPSPPGLTTSVRIILITGYVLSIALVSAPGIFEAFKTKIALEFPAAAKIGVGFSPLVLGAGVFLTVVLFRHLVWHDTKRPQAFWVISGAMGGLLLIVLIFTLPHFGKYFINPPQQLANRGLLCNPQRGFHDSKPRDCWTH